MTELVGVDEIEEARRGLPSLIRETPVVPLESAESVRGGGCLLLKLESLQVTGSYKPRAAFHVLASLGPEEREAGIVLPSSGNFGRAFALAGSEVGVPVVVVSSRGVTPLKVQAMEAHGAEVVVAETYDARFDRVGEIARERGMTPIETVADPRVIAGHGTLGLEILEQRPDLSVLVVPVSSGGLISGVAAAVRSRRPEVRVIGAQPERRPAMFESLRAGEPTSVPPGSSMADALTATSVGPLPFAHVQEWVEEVVLVDEEAIARAVRLLLFRGKVVAEPGGAVAVAAVREGAVDPSPGTVAVVTGGNIAPDVLEGLVNTTGEDP